MEKGKLHNTLKELLDPDNELLVWERWINIRKEEVLKLAEKVNRVPVDLVMNITEKEREKKEWKTVLEHAQAPIKPTVRGHLWEQKLRLHQTSDCMPAYEVQRTAVERGKPKVIEHVCVPTYIQQVEKGLIGNPERVKFQRLDKEFVKYRQKREEDLKEKITKIDPFRPKECLMVRGHKPKMPTPKLSPLPDIVISDASYDGDPTLCTVYAVRINNTVILKTTPGQDLSNLEKLKLEEWHEDCTTWHYYFNNPCHKAGRCKFFLKNLGTTSLRYYWKRERQPIPFISDENYEQVFFFQKNEDVLSPGQSRVISFTFISDKPATYNETWELIFSNINFFDTSSIRLCVHLSADAVEDAPKIQRKVRVFLDRIEKIAAFNVVKGIVDDIVMSATTVPPQEYPYRYLFLEAEMFTMKNPVCFYHQTEVKKMKDVFLEMTGNENWDLSLGSWRKAMMNLDMENRMKYYELLKISHGNLLKPWFEGDELIKEKCRAIKLILGQMADKFDVKYKELLDNALKENNIQISENYNSNNSTILAHSLCYQTVRNVFFVYAYDYICTAMETCAAILSSLDLNRWIEFDFCQF